MWPLPDHFAAPLIEQCSASTVAHPRYLALLVVLMWSQVLFAASTQTSTIYVNRHFEVRDHDAPVKYVFSRDTRVARVTGSLAETARTQRLRIQAGWNLLSIAVELKNALYQFTNSNSGAIFSAAYPTLGLDDFRLEPNRRWTDPPTRLRRLAALQQQLHARSRRHVPRPAASSVAPDARFIPGAGLESWDFRSAISKVASCIGLDLRRRHRALEIQNGSTA
jgi:hypothetical protein